VCGLSKLLSSGMVRAEGSRIRLFSGIIQHSGAGYAETAFLGFKSQGLSHSTHGRPTLSHSSQYKRRKTNQTNKHAFRT
jgi:hypothetical protein